MWHELEKLIGSFYSTGLNEVVDFEKFNRIAIVHHSSAIEGSTLTLNESTLLITDNLTAKGKPVNDHLMVKDHYAALEFCLNESKAKRKIDNNFLKQMNALVNKNTGQVRNLALGIVDDTKGDFRLGNVQAGSTYFINYDKVIPQTDALCKKLNAQIDIEHSIEQIYKLSFEAHYYLVTIHPWFDGNGRTARLLMNYIQAWHNKPLSLVFAEDKLEYIEALNKSRTENNTSFICDFMCLQMIKYLKTELQKFENRNKGLTFIF